MRRPRLSLGPMRRTFALLGSTVLSSLGLVVVVIGATQVRGDPAVGVGLIALGLALVVASGFLMLTQRSRQAQ